MTIKNCLFLFFFFIAFAACNSKTFANEINNSILTKIKGQQLTYILPSPETDGNISVEKALTSRRSHRNFQSKAISSEQLSQILWAAYGITFPIQDHPDVRGGLRTTPSAGARYPLEIYAIIGNVEGIDPGVYKYISAEHKIIRTIDKDVRDELCNAALEQGMIRRAPASVFYSAIFNRTIERYGERGRRYVYMELGHSAQNIHLQAEALRLGTCAIGAFTDSRVSQVLKLPANEEPLYIMPIGYYSKILTR